MGTQLALVEGPALCRSNLPAADTAGFDFSDLRVFDTIPEYHHDIVPLRGLVVVFDTYVHRCEGILNDAFYVRESQRPASCLLWETWLRGEVDAYRERKRHGPYSPLKIGRQVARAVRWPRPEQRKPTNPDATRAWRLESGFTDGPIYDWAFGFDVIGKVVGIYLPGGRA